MPSRADVFKYEEVLHEHGYATHTPTVDANGVDVFYGSSGAACYSHDGTLRWQTDCGTNTHGYGSACSPILFRNVLIVSANVESKAIIGLDTRTGDELWRVNTPGNVWCTPIIVGRGDDAQLVAFTEKQGIAGLDPLTGIPLPVINNRAVIHWSLLVRAETIRTKRHPTRSQAARWSLGNRVAAQLTSCVSSPSV